MNRRDFLSISASSGVGVAMAAAGSWLSAPIATDQAKGGGRALVAQPIQASTGSGALPFALARFAEDTLMITGIRTASTPVDALLSPLRDISFNGFAAGAGALKSDRLRVAAVHNIASGVTARHDFWSHAPSMQGDSKGAMLTTHDDAFAGFEVTHMPSSGATQSAFFGFQASGSGPLLMPGIYVLAGPRDATGAPPDLSAYGYSGDVRAPVRESRRLGLDFAYLSFVVHGDWL